LIGRLELRRLWRRGRVSGFPTFHLIWKLELTVFGEVGINCTSPTFAADIPFGGYKQSGVGREGIGYSLDAYLEHKAVLIKIGDDAAGVANGH
jgi:hypothetical protein